MKFSIAKIIKPHGIKGEMKVVSLKPKFEELIFNQDKFFIKDQEYKIENIKKYKQGFIIKLFLVNDMDAAEAFRDEAISINQSSVFSFLQDNKRFFTEQWIGYKVVNEKNLFIGEVEQLLYTGANDVLVVKGESEILVPVVESFILKVDDNDKTLQIVEPQYNNDKKN